MNILKTDLVDVQNDEFWEDISDLISDAVAKPTLILVKGNWEDIAEYNQLQKMLDAVKLSPEQYNIIWLKDGQKAAWHQLREKLEPKTIFLVGVMPAQLGIAALFRINQPNNFNDCVWLPTLSISELEQNPTAKGQLWNNGMKPIFVEKKFGHP